MKKPTMWLCACVAALAFVVSGCDDDDDPPPTTTPTIDWATASVSEKSAYMSGTIVPTMQPLFEAHDSAKFGSFGCATCHPGSNGFTMPNPDLPKLPADQSQFPAPGASPIVDFMYDTVTPKMTELLGLDSFDPATGEGFGCLSCHTTQ